MPLIPTAIQGLIQGKAASKSMAGSKFPSMVQAISTGASMHVLSTATVTSTNIVAGPGAGVQIGRIVGVNPSAMTSLMMSKAAAAGISGRDTMKLMESVAFGVCNSLNAVIMQGSVIGGGPGTGTGFIAGLTPPALKGIILGLMGAQVLAGSKLASIVDAMAFGICTHIQTATVSITNMGAAAPPPAGTVTLPVAPGTGRLV